MSINDITINLKNFLNESGQLKQFPARQKLQIFSLFYLAEDFEHGRTYTEKEINAVLNRRHTFGDPPMLRRYLYQFGFIDRHKDGALYWLKNPAPSLAELMPS
jgi:hypothetical protein